MPFKVLLLSLFCVLNVANAQQVIWAKKNNLDKKSNFTKVIGQNKHGIYVLKHKNNTFKKYFIVEHFDLNMNLINNVMFKIPNAQLEKIIIEKDKIIFFTLKFEKNNQKLIEMHQADSTLNVFSVTTVGNLTNYGYDFNVRVENDKLFKKQLVLVFEEIKDKTKLNYVSIENGEIKQKNSIVINHKFNEMYFGNAAMDEKGNLFLLYTFSEKFKSRNSEDFYHYLLSVNINEATFAESLINNQTTYLSNSKIEYNADSKTIYVAGFYGNATEDESKGYYVVQQDVVSFKIKSTVFTEFDRNIVAQIIGRKQEQRGEQLDKFVVRDLILKHNGGLILVSEKTYISTQNEVFYINGVPQSSYSKVYNNEEVLLLSININGLLDWFDIINKSQSSINDGGYYNGIIVNVSDNKINVIYNDRLSANADIIIVSYSELGLLSKKTLFKNDQFYALVIPLESKQVSGNGIVIPIIQNRESTYIKLIF